MKGTRSRALHVHYFVQCPLPLYETQRFCILLRLMKMMGVTCVRTYIPATEIKYSSYQLPRELFYSGKFLFSPGAMLPAFTDEILYIFR